MVNLEKSSIVFNANVLISFKKEVEEKLGIKAACNLGTYLSITSFWGKTKCEALGYVLERVKGKLKNWKQ